MKGYRFAVNNLPHWAVWGEVFEAKTRSGVSIDLQNGWDSTTNPRTKLNTLTISLFLSDSLSSYSDFTYATNEEWEGGLYRRWKRVLEGLRAQGIPSPTTAVCCRESKRGFVAENQKGEIVTTSIGDYRGAGWSPWSKQKLTSESSSLLLSL